MILKTDLYAHQRKAVEKLRHVKVGALYMEQGTGKTRTALELIKLRLDAEKVDTVLWLCPCSVKENLRRDLEKHAEDVPVEICGIETLSSSYRENARLLRLVKSKKVYLIVDESNLVKNPQAYRTKNIINISNYCRYKLILNGTPISKNEKDLFAQWYILDWRILGYSSFWSFAANHLEYDKLIPGKIVRCLNVDYLVRKMSPYTYQVKKSECLDLPPKTYNTAYYSLDENQTTEYDCVKNMFLGDVDEFKPETIYRLLTALQLVLSGRKIISKLREPIRSVSMFADLLNNPRIECLFRLINPSEKTIIFCKFSDEIETITRILNEKYGADSAVPFYGALSQKHRQKSLDSFRGASNFLVANKVCAGYGLNLQFCSYVIYYSNDYDFATRCQSEDRVHRIGQTHNVHIVDICAANKLDERIQRCLWNKESLAESFKGKIDKCKDKKSLGRWLDGIEDTAGA